MAVSISFDFYGDVQLDRTLDRFAENVDDVSPAWEVIADDFARMEREQFATEGRRASGGWAPLSPPYARWKAIHYPGAKILHRTGDLERSLTQRPFGVEVILPTYMAIGSDVDYGAYHQQGSAFGPPSPGRGRLPRRRPVELRESDRVKWVKILQRFIVTGSAPVLGPRGGLSTGGGSPASFMPGGSIGP